MTRMIFGTVETRNLESPINSKCENKHKRVFKCINVVRVSAFNNMILTFEYHIQFGLSDIASYRITIFSDRRCFMQVVHFIPKVKILILVRLNFWLEAID